MALAQLALGLITGASKGRDQFDAAWAALVPPLADPKHPLSVAGATNADLVWAVFALLEPLADDIDLGWYLRQCGQHFASCPVTEDGT